MTTRSRSTIATDSFTRTHRRPEPEQTSASTRVPDAPALNLNELSRTLTDLAECEKEALQHIGKIQSHGCLLFFTHGDHRIQSASENVADFLELSHREVLGAKLEHLLDREFCEQIFKACEDWNDRNTRGLNISSRAKDLDGYLFKIEGLFALELEQSGSTAEEQELARTRVEHVLRTSLIELKEAGSLEQLAHTVAKSIRQLTGLDRVMVYRFMPPTWYGQVIAEDRVVGAHSYMGHRFPSSDIPRIARDLYLRNGLRVISDIHSPEHNIRPAMNPYTKAALDLTDSKLRASSPVHLEYLANMKIRASISVAIVVQGQLWGLVACHHLSPYLLKRESRLACELIADAFAAQAPLIESLGGQRLELEFNDKIHKIIESLRLSQQPVRDLIKNHLELFDAFSCSGLALVHTQTTETAVTRSTKNGKSGADGAGTGIKNNESDSQIKVELAGLCPTRSQILQILPLLNERLGEAKRDSLVIHNLGELLEDFKSLASVASGILAFTLPAPFKGYFILFRPEQVETITWGGDPRKQLDNKKFEGRINPRTSFEAWTETVSGKSIHWRRFEIDGANLLNRIVFESFETNQTLIKKLHAALEKNGPTVSSGPSN